MLGNKTLCINEAWPLESVKRETSFKIAIQINGKTKEIIEINNNLSKEIILKTAKNTHKIKKNLLGKNIIREVYVPRKIINLVIK